MRKIISFFIGLILLVLVMAMLFLTSAIYDTGARQKITAYFFQTNNLSVERPGTPIRATDINETVLREMLIKKYVTEYFYVIPDTENVAVRTGARSTLAQMSSVNVFNKWSRGEAETIKKMADNDMMRTVAIDGQIFKPADGDYWIVPYVLKTWETPNDMTATPEITRGMLQISISFEPGFREVLNGATLDIGKYLQCSYNRFEVGCDPAIIFRFRVDDLEQIE